MKNLLIIGLSLLLLNSNKIKKSGVSFYKPPIIGKWKYVREFHGDYVEKKGFVSQWVKVAADSNKYVEFYENGKVDENYFSTTGFLKNDVFIKYQIKGIRLVELISEKNRMHEFWCDFSKDTLTLNFIGCVEGCGVSFVKVK